MQRVFFDKIRFIAKDIERYDSNEKHKRCLRKEVRNGESEEEPREDLVLCRQRRQLRDTDDQEDRERQKRSLKRQGIHRVQRERERRDEERVVELVGVRRRIAQKETQDKSCNGKGRAQTAIEAHEISNDRNANLRRHLYLVCHV